MNYCIMQTFHLPSVNSIEKTQDSTEKKLPIFVEAQVGLTFKQSLHLVVSPGTQGLGWRPGISGSSGTVNVGFGTNLFQRWHGKS